MASVTEPAVESNTQTGSTESFGTLGDVVGEPAAVGGPKNRWPDGIDWPTVIWLTALHVGALAAPFFFTWKALALPPGPSSWLAQRKATSAPPIASASPTDGRIGRPLVRARAGRLW